MKQEQLKQEICPRDKENMKSLHYLKRKYQAHKELGTWQKAEMKICPKCGLIFFYKKKIRYIIFPNTDKVMEIR